MKRNLMTWIVCPVCGGPLELREFQTEGDWIEEGMLSCPKGDRFPILRGIPVLIEPKLRSEILGAEEADFSARHAEFAGAVKTGPMSGHDGEKKSAAEVWGYQWQYFHELWQDEAGEDQFYRWIAPLRPEDLKGRLVLDGGCGTGRHTFYSSKHAGTVIGIDLSFATRVAARLTRNAPNAHIVQADIYRLPFRPGTFDRAYSIGVIHHLPDPKAAYLGLTKFVKSSGSVTVWLYGRENNWLAAVAVETARALVTRWMPLQLLKALCFIPAFVLWASIKIFYAPVNALAPGLAARLPYNTYFMLFNRLSFRHQWMNVFDKLNAPIANYYRRPEMETWLRESGLADTRLAHTNDISWTLHGVRVDR